MKSELRRLSGYLNITNLMDGRCERRIQVIYTSNQNIPLATSHGFWKSHIFPSKRNIAKILKSFKGSLMVSHTLWNLIFAHHRDTLTWIYAMSSLLLYGLVMEMYHVSGWRTISIGSTSFQGHNHSFALEFYFCFVFDSYFTLEKFVQH